MTVGSTHSSSEDPKDTKPGIREKRDFSCCAQEATLPLWVSVPGLVFVAALALWFRAAYLADLPLWLFAVTGPLIAATCPFWLYSAIHVATRHMRASSPASLIPVAIVLVVCHEVIITAGVTMILPTPPEDWPVCRASFVADVLDRDYCPRPLEQDTSLPREGAGYVREEHQEPWSPNP